MYVQHITGYIYSVLTQLNFRVLLKTGNWQNIDFWEEEIKWNEFDKTFFIKLQNSKEKILLINDDVNLISKYCSPLTDDNLPSSETF